MNLRKSFSNLIGPITVTKYVGNDWGFIFLL